MKAGAWNVAGGRTLCASAPFGVMGIVNLTPDSFYDGGRHADAVSGRVVNDDVLDVLNRLAVFGSITHRDVILFTVFTVI